MKTIVIEKPAGFSLDAVSEFYAGFTPGSGMAAASTDKLTLAFRLDADEWQGIRRVRFLVEGADLGLPVQ